MSTIKFPGDSIAREIVDKLARTNMGDLNSLTTTDKANIVAAINELEHKISTGDIGGEDAAKAVFIDLNEDVCTYTLAEL
jgi:hypothetical protein